jgi:hypothetical protein
METHSGRRRMERIFRRKAKRILVRIRMGIRKGRHHRMERICRQRDKRRQGIRISRHLRVGNRRRRGPGPGRRKYLYKRCHSRRFRHLDIRRRRRGLRRKGCFRLRLLRLSCRNGRLSRRLRVRRRPRRLCNPLMFRRNHSRLRRQRRLCQVRQDPLGRRQIKRRRVLWQKSRRNRLRHRSLLSLSLCRRRIRFCRWQL